MKVVNSPKKIVYYIFSIIIVLFISFLLYKLLKNEGDYSEQNDENLELDEDIRDKDNLSLINERNRQNDLKKKFMNFLESYDIMSTIDNKEIIKKIETWKNNTYPFIGIERFAIPMISTISAGKTSTLNYILNLKNSLLQIGESITTKFCVIIRDNKKYKKRIKIFNVTIEKRGEINKFNFIKQEEIKQEPKKFVEERNKLIESYQSDKKDVKDLGLYFIIMETDTGLFEGEFEKYSGLVEFFDIPGLYEKGLKDNFYFRNILPFIKPNFIFPIIILDAEKFELIDVYNYFNKIFSPYISKNMYETKVTKKIKYDIENQNYIINNTRNNAIFLINKLNLCLEEEKMIKKLKKKF